MNFDGYTIRVVETESDNPFQATDIIETLHKEHMDSGHGEEHSGRPVTRLMLSENNVVKLRTEYELSFENSKKFIATFIENEKDIAVYHPDKRWFLLQNETEDTCIIGNITPRLDTLDRMDSGELINEQHSILIDAIDLYLKTASDKDRCLDLALSNFGTDRNMRIYYIDDQTYSWDQFSSLVDFIAHLVRSDVLFDPEQATVFGKQLRDSIGQYFTDSHTITIIAEGLKSAFLPDNKLPQMHSLVKALYGNQVYSYTPRFEGGKIALIADVHANAPALAAVLEEIRHRDVVQVIMLGDVVGYGPHPNECVEMLMADSNIHVLKGNHDHSAVSDFMSGGATQLAQWSMDWTRKVLSEQSRNWLRALPPYLEGDNWLAVHGAPIDKSFFNAYVYKMSYVENLDLMMKRKLQYCFHGHTHIQKIYGRRQGRDFEADDLQLSLRDNQHTLICPGSIGQPRSGRTDAELAILDLATGELEFIRVPYDLETTVRAMNEQGFPAKMVERLRAGH